MKDKMKSLLYSASTPINLMNAQRNLSFGPRKIIAIISLILLLSSSSLVFLGKSDVHALPTRSGHSGGSVPSGIPANAGGFDRGPLQTQGGGPPSGVQPNGAGTSPLTGLRPRMRIVLVLMLYLLALSQPIVLVLMLLILHVPLILP